MPRSITCCKHGPPDGEMGRALPLACDLPGHQRGAMWLFTLVALVLAEVSGELSAADRKM